MSYDLNVRQARVGITTTSSKVCDQTDPSSRRKVLYLRNTSPNVADIITLALSSNAPAVANVGIVLKQHDQYIETQSEGFECWQGAIQAICATANGQLTILER
jgi:hypothetical protein